MSLSKESITSDKDYLKIHSDGPLLIGASGTPPAIASFPGDGYAATYTSEQSVDHNLGTVPLVRAFWDPRKNGKWWAAHAFPDSSLGLFPFLEVDPFLNIVSDTTKVRFIMGTNGSPVSDIPVFYRIYDLGNTAIDSDSRVDKIFFREPGDSHVVGAAPDSFDPKFEVISIPHGQLTAPIWSFQFSEDAQNWYGENGKIIGPPDTGSGPPGGPYSIYYYTKAYCYVDDVNFNIVFEQNYATTKQIYYRYTLDYRI